MILCFFSRSSSDQRSAEGAIPSLNVFVFIPECELRGKQATHLPDVISIQLEFHKNADQIKCSSCKPYMTQILWFFLCFPRVTQRVQNLFPKLPHKSTLDVGIPLPETEESSRWIPLLFLVSFRCPYWKDIHTPKGTLLYWL